MLFGVPKVTRDGQSIDLSAVERLVNDLVAEGWKVVSSRHAYQFAIGTDLHLAIGTDLHPHSHHLLLLLRLPRQFRTPRFSRIPLALWGCRRRLRRHRRGRLARTDYEASSVTERHTRAGLVPVRWRLPVFCSIVTRTNSLNTNATCPKCGSNIVRNFG